MSTTRKTLRTGLMAAAIAATLGLTNAANAAVVAQYTFTSPDATTANLSLASTSTDPNAAGSGLTVGSGLAQYSSTAGSTSGTDATDRAFAINLSRLAAGATGSRNSNDYLSFTVTPAAGATTARTGSVFLATDADAYASTVNNTFRNSTATTTATDTGYVATSIDLSGLEPVTHFQLDLAYFANGKEALSRRRIR